MILQTHPTVQNFLCIRLPNLHRILQSQDLHRTGSELVAVLRRQDDIAAGHDAHLEREALRTGVAVFVAFDNGVPPGLLHGGVVDFVWVGALRDELRGWERRDVSGLCVIGR